MSMESATIEFRFPVLLSSPSMTTEGRPLTYSLMLKFSLTMNLSFLNKDNGEEHIMHEFTKLFHPQVTL